MGKTGGEQNREQRGAGQCATGPAGGRERSVSVLLPQLLSGPHEESQTWLGPASGGSDSGARLPGVVTAPLCDAGQCPSLYLYRGKSSHIRVTALLGDAICHRCAALRTQPGAQRAPLCVGNCCCYDPTRALGEGRAGQSPGAGRKQPGLLWALLLFPWDQPMSLNHGNPSPSAALVAGPWGHTVGNNA